MIDLVAKKAIVTGGGTGIGKGIALALAEAGADVVVHYGSNRQGAEEVVNYLIEKGQKGVAIKADLLKQEEIYTFMQQASSFFNGEIDILVNNAGHLVERSTVEEMPVELWHKIMDVNVTSAFSVSKQAIPLMKHGGASIINMTSVAAHNGGGAGASAYAASKAAVLAFSKALAKELAPFHIRVNAVSPGFIGETPFHRTFTSPEGQENTIKGIPLQRAGLPKDVAGAVLYLASNLADFVTGETIEINGGMYMR